MVIEQHTFNDHCSIIWPVRFSYITAEILSDIFVWHGNDMAITVTSRWASWRLKSPAYRLFVQPFVQGYIKENIKVKRFWPLWWGIHRWPADSQRDNNAKNVSIWWRHHALPKVMSILHWACADLYVILPSSKQWLEHLLSTLWCRW